MRHEHFQWDGGKAAANFRKHGVRFENAVKVLSDPFFELFHVEEFDVVHSTEQEPRWITTGSDPGRRTVVLVICWTQRVDELGEIVTRIITARTATRAERKDYENHIH